MSRKAGRDWVPNVGDFYERRARSVGVSLLPEPEGRGRRGSNTGEVVLVAVDENGEVLDRLRCRWLLTNIRSTRSGGAGAHEVSSKLKELARLEQWLGDVRCEALGVG